MASPFAVPTTLLFLTLCISLHHPVVEGGRLPSPLRMGVTTNVDGGIRPASLIDHVTHKATCFSPITEYYGAQAKISVHELGGVTTGHSSMASIQVLNHDAGNKLNMIAAGWQVNPELYGDSRTRLFTYWTVDDQQQSGCFDNKCSGFVVQTGSPFAPGSILKSVSSYGGQQKYITLTIFREPTTGNWLLSYEDESQSFPVGYWPRSLFSGLGYNATQLIYGGMVGYPGYGKGAPMGSGHFASEGENKAASFKNLQYLDQYKNSYNFEQLSVDVDISQCYDLDLSGDSGDGDGVRFYYGGPAGCTK